MASFARAPVWLKYSFLTQVLTSLPSDLKTILSPAACLGHHCLRSLAPSFSCPLTTPAYAATQAFAVWWLPIVYLPLCSKILDSVSGPGLESSHWLFESIHIPVYGLICSLNLGNLTTLGSWRTPANRSFGQVWFWKSIPKFTCSYK